MYNVNIFHLHAPIFTWYFSLSLLSSFHCWIWSWCFSPWCPPQAQPQGLRAAELSPTEPGQLLEKEWERWGYEVRHQSGCCFEHVPPTKRVANDQKWKIGFSCQWRSQMFPDLEGTKLSELWPWYQLVVINYGAYGWARSRYGVWTQAPTFARIFSAPMAIPAWASPPIKGWLPALGENYHGEGFLSISVGDQPDTSHVLFFGLSYLRSIMMSCMFGAGVILVPSRVRTFQWMRIVGTSSIMLFQTTCLVGKFGLMIFRIEQKCDTQTFYCT